MNASKLIDSGVGFILAKINFKFHWLFENNGFKNVFPKNNKINIF